MTAFSTSSSSMTLPVTLKTVEERGRVSNRVTSTLPLGATINMDGTALYECIGVIFLAQHQLRHGDRADPGRGPGRRPPGQRRGGGDPLGRLVMMLTILSALELPLEGRRCSSRWTAPWT